jgi:K+-transporting ATPase ATPase C chain
VKSVLGPALRATFVTLILTGILYPLVATGLAQAIFPGKANGSIVKNDRGDEIGSSLLAQGFGWPSYFQPRPSAAGSGYDPTSSSGSNYGPTSSDLRDRAAKTAADLAAQNPHAPGPIPLELVTASGSGLDPHISPEAARWQVPRIAEARHIDDLARIQTIIDDHIEGRDLGFLGEPRVNVLVLNLALDRQFGAPEAPASQPASAPAAEAASSAPVTAQDPP